MNKACKKAGSADTLEGLRALAAVSDEANAAARAGQPLAAAQTAFAARVVESCGCLGGCGRGPNCVLKDETVLYDVYKPAALDALLKEAGLAVPEAATKAWLRRMYAQRALRQNKVADARGLLSQALQEAAVLKTRGASLLAHLLDFRADVAESQKDYDAADSDRKRAEQMRSLHADTAR